MKCLYRVVCLFVCILLLTAMSGCPWCHRGPVAGETQTFDGMEFQWIPAGTFMMGSPDTEEGRASNETLHKVTISHGFWLGKYEVTQAQWDAVMATNPSSFDGDDLPVETVRWYDAMDLVEALNAANSDDVYRLPTEAEWEYAYRAGTSTRFYWGEDSDESALDDYAWHGFNSSAQTHPVGMKMPNAWGLYDMAGNAFEWCWDWSDDYPDGPVIDPEGPGSGTNRIARGGSFLLEDSAAYRGAYRNNYPPNGVSYQYGFRLLRIAD